jgi:predicted dehydrogenase
MLNAAIIGLGWWGRQITASLADSDRIKVTHGVDVDISAARAFADTHGLTLKEKLEDVLTDASVDAVILATPHGMHEEQVLAAAAASKQVFCEKPLALSSAAAKRMIDACVSSGLILGIGHERRHEGALEELTRMVRSDEIGTLLHVEVNASYNLFAGTPASGWRQDPTQAPAGTMTALGVHITDFLQTVAGPVEFVTVRTADRTPAYPGNDVLSIQLEFESGVTGTLCSLANTPFYQRISLFGDKAWAEVRETTNVDDPAPAHLTWRGLDLEIHDRTYKVTDTVRANLHEWADAVEGRREYRFTDAQKLHNIEILEAIVASATTGERVATH